MPASDYPKRISIPSVGDLPLQEGGATLNIGGISREPMLAELAVNDGYVERRQSAELNLKLNALDSVNLEDISVIADETMTVYMASGKIYSISGCYVGSLPSAQKGSVDVVIRGQPARRV